VDQFRVRDTVYARAVETPPPPRDATRPQGTPHYVAPPFLAGTLGLATAAVAGGAARLMAGQLHTHWLRLAGSALPPDAVVGVAVLLVGLAAAIWYLATAVAALAGVLLRRDLGVTRWGAPLARRLAVGASLGMLLVVPAQADTPDDVSWGAPSSPVVVVTAPVAAVAQAAVAPAQVVAPEQVATVPEAVQPRAEPAAATPAPDGVTHVVTAGECLWRIAAKDLAARDNAAIAARVHDYVRANPQLAANPDLIHPGDILSIPQETR